MTTPLTPQPVDVRPSATPAGDDRWSRWAASGAQHERDRHKRAVLLAVIVGASLTVWGTLAIVLR